MEGRRNRAFCPHPSNLPSRGEVKLGRRGGGAIYTFIERAVIGVEKEYVNKGGRGGYVGQGDEK